MRRRRADGRPWRTSCPPGGRIAHCPAPECLLCVPTDEVSDGEVHLALARLCDMTKASAKRRNPGWNCSDAVTRFAAAGRPVVSGPQSDAIFAARMELAILLTIRMYQDACYEQWLHRACGFGGVAKAVNCANPDRRRWFADAGGP